MDTITFSAYWQDTIGQAIAERNVAPYPMSLVGPDIQACVDVVNQGIDSRLQACFVPDRGDKFERVGNRLECLVSAESLPILVRRLLESDNEHANSLAIDICQNLEIELI